MEKKAPESKVGSSALLAAVARLVQQPLLERIELQHAEKPGLILLKRFDDDLEVVALQREALQQVTQRDERCRTPTFALQYVRAPQLQCKNRQAANLLVRLH